jgi:hypothetical protein
MLPPSRRTRRHLQGRDKSRSKVPVPLKLKSWGCGLQRHNKRALSLSVRRVRNLCKTGPPATFLADEKSEELALFPHRIET